MTISLIRHGRTEANIMRLYCGNTDVDLSGDGVNELNELKKTIVYPNAGVYAASGLKRAVQTLNILYDEPKHFLIPDLMEYNFGDFEMKTHEELENLQSYRDWIESETVRCPNGESRKEFNSRVVKGLNKLKTISDDGRLSVACVCHGGVIAVLMESLFPGKRGFYEWRPGFGRGYAIRFGVNIEYSEI